MTESAAPFERDRAWMCQMSGSGPCSRRIGLSLMAVALLAGWARRRRGRAGPICGSLLAFVLFSMSNDARAEGASLATLDRARAFAAEGRLLEARELYVRVLRQSSESNEADELRARATAELRTLDRRTPLATLELVNAGTEPSVWLDGKRLTSERMRTAIPLDPGRHVIEAESDGRRARAEFSLGEYRHRTVMLDVGLRPSPLRAQPNPPGARLSFEALSAITLGVGGVALATGVSFALVARARTEDADALFEKRCARGCASDEPAAREIAALDAEARSAQTLALLAVALGTTSLAAGVALRFIVDRKRTRPTRGSVQPFVGFGGAGVRTQF